MNGLLVILSSPSGTGKTSIARRLIRERGDVDSAISATTRPPRAMEEEGIHYYFTDSAEFDRQAAAGEFAEWAEYGGAKYGTLRSEIDRIRSDAKHVLLDIEVQGGRIIREKYSEAVSIFLLPPSGATLLDRLRGRRTESDESLARRLAHAEAELREAPTYDYVVVNDDLDEAVRVVGSLIDSATRSPGRSPGVMQTIEAVAADLIKARERLGHSPTEG